MYEDIGRVVVVGPIECELRGCCFSVIRMGPNDEERIAYLLAGVE